MQYKKLGRSGLMVSRLCLGTMNFGAFTSEKESFEIMNRALELGINFFDTANVYGGKKGEGITEKIIGRWLEENSERRDKIVLASKVYGAMGDGINEKYLSAYHIKKACEDSLKRLKTDHIDLYQMHHIHRDTPWDEIWQAMEQLIREGKIIYVGSSNFAGWDIATANEEARNRNMLGLISEQSKYNLFNRKIEHEVVPSCKYYGVGIVPWSPLEGGLLGGVLKGLKEGRRNSEEIINKLKNNREQIEKWEIFCDELGEEPANTALAWLLSKPGVTSPIIGPRTIQQLEASQRAFTINFSEESLSKLDAIFPPAGESPQYYAW
ncbi:MAG: oxidoreductase [Ignavibacteria bacterium CG2_30_36_16]|nr:aldo/keto reductase [Ignavibacteria bacterium]OIP58531.1 MAG: oxidoreductase [Ignavibacteria bacterium CG2_30_36_16]PJB01721.1 MAG: aldo/keto reductase [Ignavibacteria bacterium CG_4_9_14_3_um_filter_36_18]